MTLISQPIFPISIELSRTILLKLMLDSHSLRIASWQKNIRLAINAIA